VSTRIAPASEVPWDDVVHSLTGGGDGGSCWCQWFPLSRREFDAESRDERRDRLRAEIEDSPLPPALVAYVDDQAAGWVRIGPRTAQGRLTSTRMARSSAEPLDDPAVWAVTCLVVRREHRGRGLAGELVEAAVAFASAHGARLIEAYPIDRDVRPDSSSNQLFVGSVGLFERAGFRVTARPTPTRAVMTRTVEASV
jgi:ribosomal protein S18 acetylase RimI-like enzyme